MNASRREMDFIQELEKNSVSITQISTAQKNIKQNQMLQNNFPNVNISTVPIASVPTIPSAVSPASNQSNLSKYSQLLMVIEEMGKDIRPTYSGSRSSAERLKRTIVTARILVRECLLETERQQSGR